MADSGAVLPLYGRCTDRGLTWAATSRVMASWMGVLASAATMLYSHASLASEVEIAMLLKLSSAPRMPVIWGRPLPSPTTATRSFALPSWVAAQHAVSRVASPAQLDCLAVAWSIGQVTKHEPLLIHSSML